MKKPVWIVLACLLAGLFCAAYPMYVIRPFRAQGPDELAAALVVLRYRPWVTVACALLAVIAAALYWRAGAKRFKQIAMVAGALIVCLSAVASRINVFEIMFHPVSAPAFAAAGTARLDADDKVLTVRVGGAARGYPIRAIAYHHIVNDTVGGVPIVATY
jgi:hypothetical protein